VFLVGVTLAGVTTRAFGTRSALLLCAALVGLAGAAALAFGRRDPELMRPHQPPAV